MYKIEGRVRYSECGEDHQLKLSSIINYFQDCTTEHSEQAGVGFSYLKRKKRAWILNSWQVVIHRCPQVSEKIEVSTWATGFKGVFGPRDFCMRTPEGEILAKAHTLWVYIDTETGRPTKPDEEEMQAYQVEPPLDFETASRKIDFSKDAEKIATFPVYKYHIDTNHHMNNSKYVELACEGLPENYQVRQLRVEYKKAAVLGDILTAYRAEEKERIVVGLCDMQRRPYAIVEIIGEQQ